MTPEEIAVKFEHDEQEIKSLNHRVKKCEEQQTLLNKLVNSVDKLAINMEYMAKEQQEQGKRLERLEQEPAENFKHYKRLILGCVITGVVGTILGAVLVLIFKEGLV